MNFDLPKLIDAVLAADTNRGSHLHGEVHWKCVSWTGLQLADSVVGVDRAVVFLFGLFHDSQRRDDGRDIDHGRRAAELVKKFRCIYFNLEDDRVSLLIDACAGHVDGRTSSDPTIGACWDADRLNLWRISVEPLPKFLSTAAAQNPQMILRAKLFEGKQLGWQHIYDAIARK